jgi:glucokinase
MSSMYLAADIGGTNCRVAISDIQDGRWRIRYRGTYPSQSYPSAEWILRDFLGACGSPALTGAGIAVAGPVVDGRAQLTNVTWQVDAARLAAALDDLPVVLLNDFEAIGHGLSALGTEDLVTLQPGQPQSGAPKLLVGAGTGLGVGLLVPCGDQYKALSSEGGHADFAPHGDTEITLLRHLSERHGHVSWERIVSGPGLEAIYGFLREKAAEGPKVLPASEVAEAALAQTDTWAVWALETFVSAYGAFAGNLALALLPRGGIFIAGGIAPRILPKLTDGLFLRSFSAKGRFAGLLAEMPVHVVTNGDVGLLGALEAARARSGTAGSPKRYQ